jgi:hypothetical protein
MLVKKIEYLPGYVMERKKAILIPTNHASVFLKRMHIKGKEDKI